jgi:hypothetical protein
MIGNDNKIPKILRKFFRVSTLKGVPRRPADAGVGAVESLRHHVQHLILVWGLSK